MAFVRTGNSIDDRLVLRFWDMDRFVDPATEEARPEPLPLAQVLRNVDALNADLGLGQRVSFDLYYDYLTVARRAA
jgi:hypothetical protein